VESVSADMETEVRTLSKDIDRIFKSSAKAELIEKLTEELETHDKVVVVLIEDKDEGCYSSLVLMLGIERSYEAYGILDVAKQDLQSEE